MQADVCTMEPVPAARITGYASVLLILALAASGIGWIRHEAFHCRRLLRVHFPELGTLMPDDPVTRAGVPIGRIRRLTLDPGNPGASLAEIELFHRGFIPEDAGFVNFNYSLMGSRVVVLAGGR